MTDELLNVTESLLEWIDAVPDDTVLPAMPGIDRDWVDSVIESYRSTLNMESEQTGPVRSPFDLQVGECATQFAAELGRPTETNLLEYFRRLWELDRESWFPVSKVQEDFKCEGLCNLETEEGPLWKLWYEDHQLNLQDREAEDPLFNANAEDMEIQWL